MKRCLAILAALLLLTPCFSVFAAEEEGVVSFAQFSFEKALLRAVRSTLPEEEVAAVWQEGVLLSSDAQISGADGVPYPVGAKEQTLTPGDRVFVGDDESVLKIYTAAEVVKTEKGEDGEETRSSEVRRFELKTVYFSRSSRFVLRQASQGLELFLESSSLSYTFAADAFLDGEFTLSTPHLSCRADERYLSLGTDAQGSAIFFLGGKGELNLSFGTRCRSMKKGDGFFVSSDAAETRELSAPLFSGGEKEADATYSAALLRAVLENSALAESCVQALAALDDAADFNAVREAYEKAREHEREVRARAYRAEEVVRTVCAMTVDDFLAKDYQAPLSRETEESVWNLVLPQSCAAYEVRSSGKKINLAALSSKSKVDVFLTLAVPLADAKDELKLVLGKKEFAVSLTEGTAGYLFRLPVSTLKKLYAKDPSEKTISVKYKTEKTNFFLAGEGVAYSVVKKKGEDAPEAGKSYSVKIRLNEELYAEDEFYLSFTNGKGKTKQIPPTAVAGEENTFLFTVKPTKGANFAEVVFSSLHELVVENRLEGEYSAKLSGVAGEGLVASGTRPVLRLFDGGDGEFVPVVLQVSGDVTEALGADENGCYPLQKIGANTRLILSLGYPVSMPEESKLYSVEPVAGFSADYAEAGGEYRFKVHLSHDAALGTSILVKNNGVTLSPDSDGVYIIAEVTQPVRLSVTHGVTYSIILPTGDNFTVSPYGGDGTTVLENGTFRFTLQMTDKEAEVSQVAVAANETVLTPDASGIYTVTGIQRDVYITVRVLSSFKVTISEGDGYTVRPLQEGDGTVLSGGDYRFAIDLDESVHPESVLTVTAGDKVIKPKKGVYKISKISGDVAITVRLTRAFSVTLPEEHAAYSVTSADGDVVLYGESYTFSVTPKGKQALTVYVNGRKAEGVAGVYTVERVYGDLYVSVAVEKDDDKTHKITLSSEGAQATAHTATRVKDGGSFVFSVSVEGTDPETVFVTAKGGTLKLQQKLETADGLYLLYAVENITEDCSVSVKRIETPSGTKEEE